MRYIQIQMEYITIAFISVIIAKRFFQHNLVFLVIYRETIEVSNMLTQEQITYVINVTREQLDNIDRELLNITTLLDCEGDDLLNYTIKTMLEVKEKATYLLHTLERFLERAKMNPTLDIKELIIGINTIKRFLNGIEGSNLSVPLE